MKNKLNVLFVGNFGINRSYGTQGLVFPLMNAINQEFDTNNTFVLAEKLYKDVHKQKWPKWDEKLIKQEQIELVVQINGKVRAKAQVESGLSEQKAFEAVKELENIKKYLDNKEIKKIIFVPDRLINIVI